MILVNKDSQFLAKQYLKALGEIAPGGINKITSIYDPYQSSLTLLTAPDECLNVLITETFDERAEDYNQFEKTIVICEQVDKSIAKVVEDFTIKLPKLEEWQIFDYAKTICPSIDEEDLTWLIKATNNDIYRVINELDKVALFRKEEQKAIFSSIRFDPQTDLHKADLFTIVNALVDGNKPVLFNFLKLSQYDEIDPVVLANRVFNSLKNILLVTQLPAEELGMSSKQHYTLRNKYSYLNINAVKQKIKFLTNFDLALKTSRLEMSKRDMLNYLINNLSYKIN